jgi:hypothetical protein
LHTKTFQILKLPPLTVAYSPPKSCLGSTQHHHFDMEASAPHSDPPEETAAVEPPNATGIEPSPDIKMEDVKPTQADQQASAPTVATANHVQTTETKTTAPKPEDSKVETVPTAADPPASVPTPLDAPAPAPTTENHVEAVPDPEEDDLDDLDGPSFLRSYPTQD